MKYSASHRQALAALSEYNSGEGIMDIGIKAQPRPRTLTPQEPAGKGQAARRHWLSFLCSQQGVSIVFEACQGF